MDIQKLADDIAARFNEEPPGEDHLDVSPRDVGRILSMAFNQLADVLRRAADQALQVTDQ